MVGWVCFVGKNALFIIERGRSEGKRKVDIFFLCRGKRSILVESVSHRGNLLYRGLECSVCRE